MADLKLDILVTPTYNKLSLGITDVSTYPTNPPVVSSATIEIDVPGFGKVMKPFNPGCFNLFTSTSLGINSGSDQPLPDGIYHFKYSVAPAYANFVEKSSMRVDQIQEKFDSAFMKLDIMECEKSIKAKTQEDLNSIYLFIQASIAAANNCANQQAMKLYNQANRMLDSLLNNNNCGCF